MVRCRPTGQKMCPIKDTEAGSGGFQNGGLLEDSHGTGDGGRATDDDPGVIAMSAKKREARGPRVCVSQRVLAYACDAG